MFTLLFLTFYIWLVVDLTFAYLIPAVRRRRVVKRDYRDLAYLQLTIFAAIFLLFYFAFFSYYSGIGEVRSPLLYWLGVPLTFLGEGFRVWAIVTLGKYFTPVVEIQEGHGLVVKGPYRFVRHPAYTGALFAVLGMSLLTGSILSLVSFLLVFVGFQRRIANEEKVLISKFGDEYTQKFGRKKRLIPLIW
ncbi:isoprenylcysteine carboxylmethyltransferase family protein [Metallosphaera tengchongensis]|uniref:Isoprenylcysteine carboxylmethyltransferase family protein n=1 Tax=Metallosphaera tengchongensis TaxID=1532350 RepID=A0A6N0NZ10_9CREN|nr:isoprenylcysteine carboxylmethyltransferase family protein [Metallosphaera tengchongensis]QKR00779.1 isoprenylcysteine carboxylmethyltransferase family protein [Metallosphaera tengchongensis]